MQKIKTPTLFQEVPEYITKLEAQEASAVKGQELLSKAEARLSLARKTFGNASAAHLSESNGHPPQGLPAEAKLKQAQTELEQVEAIILAVRRSQARLEIEAFSVRERLRAELHQYRERVTQEFIEANMQVIRAYRKYLEQRQALAAALGDKPDVNTFVDGVSAIPWQENKDAQALHDQHCKPFQWLQKLDRLLSEGEYRALHPESYPPLDAPVDRTRYTVRTPFRLCGKDFQKGDRLSAFNVPNGATGVLKKLTRADKIRPIHE